MTVRYSVRSLLPQISITLLASIAGAISTAKNRRSGVYPSTNFDLGSPNSLQMPSDTEADARALHSSQPMEMIFSPITSTPETQCAVRTILRRE